MTPPDPAPGRGVEWARLTAGLWTALVLALTLAPASPARDLPTELCLVCGERGASDAALNLLLLLPLGAALALARMRALRVFAWIVVLPLGIEISQHLIPGRHPTPSDVLYNALGGGLGWALARRWPRWVHSPRDPRSLAPWTPALGVLAVLGSTAALLRPSLPETLYFGQWVPELGHLASYSGSVLEARLGDMPLPSGRLASSDEARRRLGLREPLRAVVRLGRPPGGLAPVVSVYDELQQEVILLGIDGRDLVWRHRLVADDLRFDRPHVRWAGALRGLEPGDTVSLLVSADVPPGVCLSVVRPIDGGEGERKRCGLGPTLGRGWSLAYEPGSSGLPVSRILDGGWVAILFLLVGWWSAPGLWRYLAGAVPFAGLGLLPLASPVLVPSVLELGIAALALLLGGRLRDVSATEERGGRPTAPV